jgi:outer membrane biosynthesis protein TonB
MKISYVLAFLLHLPLLLLLTKTNHNKPVQQINVNLSLASDNLPKTNTKQKKFINNNNLNNKTAVDHKINKYHQPIASVKNKNAREIVVKSLPYIPDDLRYEVMSEDIIARFFVNEDGLVSDVELVKASSNLKFNLLLQKKLKEWRFSAENYSSTHDIKINFSVVD